MYICVRGSDPGVPDSCELIGIEPRPLEDQPVLLTNELSLQPQDERVLMEGRGVGS